MAPYKKTHEGDRDEHAVIGGVSGKKVFVIDNAGNQIISFGLATVAIDSQLSYYKNASLASGYVFHGQAAAGSNPTTSLFQLRRETLDTGEFLFGQGITTFTGTWSISSMPSIAWS